MAPTSAAAGTSKKRAAEAVISGSKNKVQKVHPFFSKPATVSKESDGLFKWDKPLGSHGSCLHGLYASPTSSSKVAAFDLDGTIIKGGFGKGSNWEWWRSIVPAKIKKLSSEGCSIVIISNQALKPPALKQWKEKIPLIAAALDVPFHLFAATAKDFYRKPMIGMYAELERIFQNDGVTIDKSASFFVGDAAGRQYNDSKADFASTDRKWALNVGLPFHTPEEYFLDLPPNTNFKLHGFHVSSLPSLPQFTPTGSPLVPNPPKQEVVVMTGYPCLGKSTLYRKHFGPEGYVHVNQDTLGSRAKCVKAVEQALSQGKSCVVDNTNRDALTRKYYVDVAKKTGASIRCLVFTGPMELAWHNNLYRAFSLPTSKAEREPKRDFLPYSAFTSFRESYEEPQLSEGFAEIKKVNWVFEGSEDERQIWSMWHQIDGK